MLLGTSIAGLSLHQAGPMRQLARPRSICVPNIASCQPCRRLTHRVLRHIPDSQVTTTTTTSSSFFTPSLCRTTKRHASTSSAGPISGATPSTTVLDWNTFFQVRKSRRRYSLTASIVSAVGTTAATFVVLSAQPELADQVTKLVPADPFTSMGLATFAAGLLGWLIGPFFGNLVWRILHRSRMANFVMQDKAFYERIKKNRVNPAGASTTNPVPDFYGERIDSVQSYRKWLKDQRAFNHKRMGIYHQP